MENLCNEFSIETATNCSLLETYLESRTNVILDTRDMPTKEIWDILSIMSNYKKKIIIAPNNCKLDDSFTIHKLASILYNSYINNNIALCNVMKYNKPISFTDSFGCNMLFIYDGHDLSSLHWKFIQSFIDDTILICIIQYSSQKLF